MPNCCAHDLHEALGSAAVLIDAEIAAIHAEASAGAAPADLDGFTAATTPARYAPNIALEPIHLDIALDFDFDAAKADASITHTIRCNRAGGESASDAMRKAVSSLKLHGVALDNVRVEGDLVGSFEYTGKEIHIDWTKPFARGEERKVTIKYTVEQPVAGMYFNHANGKFGYGPHGTHVITDHETERARYWLATIDEPTVRPKLTFHLTAPAHMEALANGNLVSTTASADGARKTTVWHLDYPCPSYLLCLAVGEFNSVEDAAAQIGGRTVPIKYFGTKMMPAEELKRGLDQTKHMIEWLSNKLQFDLPWDKYYQISSPYSGGAMENISFVTWGDFVHMDERQSRDFKMRVDSTNIHEAVHTWFGDVTVIRYFESVWLKESFATYLPLVYQSESYPGANIPPQDLKDYGRFNMLMTQERYMSATAGYLRPVVCKRYDHSWNMFDAYSYPGGAMRIHMLRGLLGDDVFWSGLSKYLHKFAGKTVTTDDLRKVLEAESGLNLVQFFDQWFTEGKGHPTFKPSFGFDPARNVAHLTLEQTQADAAKGVPLFAMDVPVHFVSKDGEVFKAVAKFDGTNAKAVAIAHTGGKPVRVELDPHGFQLFALPDSAFVPAADLALNAAELSDDVVQRIRAYRGLIKEADFTTLRKVRALALKEKSPWVRQEIVAALKAHRHEPMVSLALELVERETNDYARTAMLGHLEFKHPAVHEYAQTKLADAQVKSGWTYLQIAALVRMLAVQADAADFQFVADLATAKGDSLKGIEFYNQVQAEAIRSVAKFRTTQAAELLLSLHERFQRENAAWRLKTALVVALAQIAAWVHADTAGVRVGEALAELVVDESSGTVRMYASILLARAPHAIASKHAGTIRNALVLQSEQAKVTITKALTALGKASADKDAAVNALKGKVAALEKSLAKVENKYFAQQEQEVLVAKTAAKAQREVAAKATEVSIEKAAAAATAAAKAPITLNHLDGHKVVRTPEEIKNDLEALITTLTKVYDQIAALPEEQCTFESVFLRTARLDNRALGEFFALGFLKAVAPEKEVRDASNDATKRMTDFMIEVNAREDLYRVAKAAYARLPKDLDPQDQRLVDRIMRDYRRQGLELPKAEKDELVAMRKRISDLSREFSRNIAEDKTFVAVTREELDGMSEDYIKSLKTTDDGKYKVTMDYPSRLPLMKKCKVAETRRKVDEAGSTMCPENKALLEEMMELRAKCAAILGYRNHSHFRLEINMAKDPETVTSFLDDLRTKLQPLAKQDYVRLLEIKNVELAKQGLPKADTLDSWDVSYYQNILVETEYALDQEQLKPYFSFEVVTKGMLDMYAKILGIKFVQVRDAVAWHEDVTLWRCYDAKTNNLLGSFYMDLYPRDGAFTHAAVFPIRPGCQLADGSYQTPIAAMKCNFTKPTKEKPSLLTHDEVVTYFHEFGHVLHHMCSAGNVKHAVFSGTATARDFSEAPSQLYENWVWDPSVLTMLSSHYKTGAKIPSELVEKLVATKFVCNGLFYSRQLLFCLFDMAVHQIAPGSKCPDTTELYNQIAVDVSLISPPANSHRQTTFAHITAATILFSADMFAKFEAAPGGIFDKAVGEAYRYKVIGVGGSREEMDSLREFLGREPNSDAFLKSIGL
ncbi:hypothetical protein BCR44DRAFT_1434945 [Catenaria anguillulae PL171]|uniref:Peptidase M3A/M3B catalytic domain-containing protein n=1 Tax=Catenaria anguillulae PL171 TaxID=765915 RepID=A0A1Y2HKE5_9FUNG|nr:hypothetical protein BCR44DRAFT_1434945 [Catenaria anguillulae PL171]